MQNPPPVQTPKSSTGLDENIAALLSYVFGWVSGLIFFLIEKDSRLVRFHAMQSLLLQVVFVVLAIVIWVIVFVLVIIASQVSGLLSTLVSIVATLIWIVLILGIVVAWIMCLIKAYQSQYFKLPVIGNFAEKFSQK
ncbi:MAG TPA: DUF4870 domain-containing protein [Pyrinomonadaceae bacterium]